MRTANILTMRKINSGNFKRYGWVIEGTAKKPKNKKNSLFSIVLTEPIKTGWRIAHLLLRDKSVTYLERHIDSFESFEPIRGETIIYVAGSKDLKSIKCFYLDKPVILKKGVWHGVITLGKQSEIKITENAKVRCDYWQLGCKLLELC